MSLMAMPYLDICIQSLVTPVLILLLTGVTQVGCSKWERPSWLSVSVAKYCQGKGILTAATPGLVVWNATITLCVVVVRFPIIETLGFEPVDVCRDTLLVYLFTGVSGISVSPGT